MQRTLYHGTTQEGAQKILSEGVLRTAPGASARYGIYLTSSLEAVGYGDGTILEVIVDDKDLELDDEFPDGRQDFAIYQTSYRPISVKSHAISLPGLSSLKESPSSSMEADSGTSVDLER